MQPSENTWYRLNRVSRLRCAYGGNRRSTLEASHVSSTRKAWADVVNLRASRRTRCAHLTTTGICFRCVTPDRGGLGWRQGAGGRRAKESNVLWSCADDTEDELTSIAERMRTHDTDMFDDAYLAPSPQGRYATAQGCPSALSRLRDAPC
jgi:hypothetical protein